MSTTERKEISFMGYTLVTEVTSSLEGKLTKKTFIEVDNEAPVAVQVTRAMWTILVGGAISSILARAILNVKRE